MLDLRPLRSGGFRHLASAVWINELGNSIGEVALTLLVYDRTGSALASASLFLALRFLPAALAPLLAAYVEAMRPRIVLTVLYLAEACLFAGIAAVAHRFSLPLVLAIVSVDGILAIVAATLTRSATANNLVAAGLLREGNGLVNIGTMIAFASGPIVAGVVVAWRGASVALFVDAATFMLTALAVVSTREISLDSDREAGFSGRIRAGAAVLRSRVALRRLLVATTLTFGLSSVAVPIEVVFAQTTLHTGSSGYGLLLTCWGIGMIAGSLVFAVGTEIPLMRLLGCATLLVVLGYAGLAASPTLAVACAFSWLGGCGNGAAWIAAMTAIQERTPANAQTAVMSVLYALNQVLPAAGFVAGGLITTLSSPRVAYAVSAAGTALALATFIRRPVDRVELGEIGQAQIDTEQLPLGQPMAKRPDPQETALIPRSTKSPPITIG
jgi:predicted MFS family arabinose efflux permease